MDDQLIIGDEQQQQQEQLEPQQHEYIEYELQHHEQLDEQLQYQQMQQQPLQEEQQRQPLQELQQQQRQPLGEHVQNGQHPQQRKHSSGEWRKKSNVGNGGRLLLKILIPNFVAGRLIGKAGSNINDLETKFEASIQVSPSKEFYPGTGERIVTVSADPLQIVEFSKYMIEHVQVNQESDTIYAGFQHDFKIVITNIAAGLVMGKGGCTIKSIQKESGAKINISKQDESNVPGERLLKISGSLEQRSKACTQIIEKMVAEPRTKISNSNIRYDIYDSPVVSVAAPPPPPLPISPGNLSPPPHVMSQPNPMVMCTQPMPYFNYNFNYNYAQLTPVQDGTVRYTYNYGTVCNSYELPPSPTPVYPGKENNVYVTEPSPVQGHYEPKSRIKTTHLIQMEIPNSIVGAIVGKQGQTINEFTRASGAHINFSAKDEFAPGTTNRILTIKGGKNQIQNAYMLIDQKIAQVGYQFYSNGLVFMWRVQGVYVVQCVPMPQFVCGVCLMCIFYYYSFHFQLCIF